MAVNLITRNEAESLIQTQLLTNVFEDVPQQSAVLSLATRLPNMTSATAQAPVLSMLPMAYWVNGDTGVKQTTRAAWDNVVLRAGELAVIVPIPENVIADSSYDIMGMVQPRIIAAMAQAIDSAIIFGINRPVEWQNDIVTLARQAKNNVAGPISYTSIMGPGGIISEVEEAGYIVDGYVAAMTARAALRNILDTNQRPIFSTGMQEMQRYYLDGSPIYFPVNGAFDPTVAQIVAGNWASIMYSIRQDVTVKILDQSVIQDPATGEIVYNLAQQDMIALRVTMRLGWALPNPATAMNPNRTEVPFSYIEPTTPFTDYDATFTVTDGTDPIENAEINLGNSIIKTNTSGQAVYHLRNGEYSYRVKATGHRQQNGSIVVDGGVVTQAVTMPKNA